MHGEKFLKVRNVFLGNEGLTVWAYGSGKIFGPS
jgi:hypothetical protein